MSYNLATGKLENDSDSELDNLRTGKTRCLSRLDEKLEERDAEIDREAKRIRKELNRVSLQLQESSQGSRSSGTVRLQEVMPARIGNITEAVGVLGSRLPSSEVPADSKAEYAQLILDAAQGTEQPSETDDEFIGLLVVVRKSITEFKDDVRAVKSLLSERGLMPAPKKFGESRVPRLSDLSEAY